MNDILQMMDEKYMVITVGNQERPNNVKPTVICARLYVLSGAGCRDQMAPDNRIVAADATPRTMPIT